VPPAGRSRIEELERGLLEFRSGAPGAADRLARALRAELDESIAKRLSARGRRWSEVDDLVQQVLIEALREVPSLPPDAGAPEVLRNLRRIAACRVRDALRNHQRLVGESAVDLAAGPARAPTESTGPITAADRRRFLEELVERLPEKYADAVRLCGLEGFSCVEAGAHLGLEADTVRKRYETARQALARRLGNRESV